MREARAIMADLAGSGLTPDQLALIMELSAAVTAEARPVSDEAADRRRAKDRERKRSVRGNPQTSAESADKSVSPTPPSEKTPIPPLKGGTSPKSEASLPAKPTDPVKTQSAWSAIIWAVTPSPGRRRSGKQSLETALRAAIRRGADPAAIQAGVEGYYASPDATKADGEYAQGVHVVINSGRWEAFVPELEAPRQAEDEADPWPLRLKNWRLNAYWHSDWGPKPGKPGCTVPPDALLAAGYVPPPRQTPAIASEKAA